MSELKDVRLLVEIKNKQSLELLDLSKSLSSLSNQFSSYAGHHGDSKENRESKLYVKEIRSGSVILELMEVATFGVLPFVENVNTIIGFAEYVGKAYRFFLGKDEEAPKEFTSNDYKDLSQIINPVANENGSQMNVSTTVNGDVHLHFHINTLEANAAQNKIEKEEKKLSEPLLDEEVKTKVLLTWFQARNDLSSNVGNKGTIEDLSSKPLNIIIDDDKIKDQMLHQKNPFTTVFVVDVKLLHAKGRLIAYKVVNLHETFEAEERA